MANLKAEVEKSQMRGRDNKKQNIHVRAWNESHL